MTRLVQSIINVYNVSEDAYVTDGGGIVDGR
jgi:hypothetical protein